jgi:hypothetical protein
MAKEGRFHIDECILHHVLPQVFALVVLGFFILTRSRALIMLVATKSHK